MAVAAVLVRVRVLGIRVSWELPRPEKEEQDRGGTDGEGEEDKDGRSAVCAMQARTGCVASVFCFTPVKTEACLVRSKLSTVQIQRS